jgi:hypothetical protein
MRRLAEAGGTPHELMAFSGHRTLSQVQHYTSAADKKRLADSGEYAENKKLRRLHKYRHLFTQTGRKSSQYQEVKQCIGGPGKNRMD